MHPSKAIRGKRSRELEGRTIVLGVTASIAAVESVKVARELIRHGADVRAVMSPEATRIVGAEALSFATGHPPIQQLTGHVEHVTWLGPGEGRADLYLIAPATANTLSKIAHGIDDTPVTSFASVALGGGVPVVLAPAMHADMGRNPAIRENLAKLRRWGVAIVEPTAAEGEEKLASPEEIAHAVLRRLARGPWAGKRVVVIGGASREPIDAVRSITNESSGRTAIELALAASVRGAQVELWAGGLQHPPPAWIPLRRWNGAQDLLALIRRRRTELRRAAMVIVPAALADYTLPARPGKISSRNQPRLTLRLAPAPKVLPVLRRAAPSPSLLVGFKLESGAGARDLIGRARALRKEFALDAVVANERGSMGAEDAEVQLVVGTAEPVVIRGPKAEVASRILDALGSLLPRSRRSRTRPRSRSDVSRE